LFAHDPRVTKCEELPVEFPLQYQPGLEYMMLPRPVSELPGHVGTGKLHNKIAIITGGDSGIGRAVAYLFHSPSSTCNTEKQCYSKYSAEFRAMNLSVSAKKSVTKQVIAHHPLVTLKNSATATKLPLTGQDLLACMNALDTYLSSNKILIIKCS
jgi:hypothetical protein